jgi:N-succinyldiaminopimelate aminotransferase
LREALAAWITRRYGLDPIDPAREVIPVVAAAEALFSIAQAVVDPGESEALVMAPNPF